MVKKNVVRDVIPPKKSIRNIKLPNRSGYFNEDESYEEVRARNIPKKTPSSHDDDFSQSIPIKQNPMRVQPKQSTFSNENIPPSKNISTTYNYQYALPPKKRGKGKYFAGLLLILVIAFGVSYFFKSAEIRVTPQVDTKTLDSSFTAKKDITGSTDLGFQIVKVSKDVEKTVSATGEEQVEKKAQGKIIIYNNYSSASQNLVATTRFETPDGLIYRLLKDVTVPGKQTIAGKTVAGSIEVTVEADKAGDKYNIGLVDFTIPGFKGTPKFTGFYARSKTEMSGGFLGMQKVVSKDDLDSAEIELEATLRDTLSKEIVTQIPDNFVMYDSAVTYSTQPITQGNSTTGSVVLKKTGTASAVIFDKSSLSRAIMSKISPELLDDPVKVVNLENLTFSMPEGVVFNPETSSLINFNLKGTANLVWYFDENQLKTDLLGLSKTKAKSVIQTYGTIKEAWIETKPFWNQTIPKDPGKVVIINTLTK